MTESHSDPAGYGAVAYATALHRAQSNAPEVYASSKHYDGYPYASLKDVQRKLLPVLLDHGLLVHPPEILSFTDLEQETRGGGVQYMTTLELLFRVTHVESGWVQTYRHIGRRTNDKDKGIQHARSSAMKAFLLDLLQTNESIRPVGRGKGSESPLDEERDRDGDDPEGRAPEAVTGSRPTRRQGQEPSPPQQNAATRRIPEARGVAFRKVGDDEHPWVLASTGEHLPGCPACKNPMLEVPPGTGRWLCVDMECGTYLAGDGSDGDPPPLGSEAQVSLKRASNEGQEGAQGAEAERKKGEPRKPNAAEYEGLKAAWLGWIRKNHVEDWQVAAFARVVDEVRDNPDQWGYSEYETALTTARRNPSAFQNCARTLASKEPLGEELVRELKVRLDDVDAPIKLRARVEEAIGSGWHDAGAWMLEELDAYAAGQESETDA